MTKIKSDIEKELEWLEREVEKDKKEIESTKKRQIKEITSLNKKEMFQNKKKKLNFFDRLYLIFNGRRK